MKASLAQKAISEAVKGNWEDAITLNLSILKSDPKDTDCLNRLAKAYCEVGKISKAKQTAKKALKLDPYNKIALKCLEKWKDLKECDVARAGKTTAKLFIEQPGKTKIVELTHLSSGPTIAKLDAGDELILNLHGHRVSVIDGDGKYVGRLPDDIGSRIKKLIKMGKEYQLILKSVTPNHLTVFIREISSSPETDSIPSFTSDKIEYVSFIPPELVHKKDPLFSTEEE